jgi:hypothetical protein
MKPRHIPHAVRLALYGSAIAVTPALIATGVGIAHGRVAQPIVRCQRGHEVAVCAEHPVALDELELHRDEIVLPQLDTALPPGTQSAIEAALMPPIGSAQLADPGVPLGTPLPLLSSG